MELFKASRQWQSRPADERFASVQELHAVCSDYRSRAKTAQTTYGQLTAQGDGAEVKLIGQTGTSTRLTHWAFGQLCQRANAPAGYLRDLPSDLASQCVNVGLKERAADPCHLMFHSNGDLILRSLTSDRYDRIWNSDVTSRLLQLLDKGWRVPPARPAIPGQAGVRKATEADVLGDTEFGLSVNVGDYIAPAGLYASDHDMFAFMVNPARRIEDGSEGGLSRGFFVWNSEVGAASFGMTRFFYRHVCGNHIVWGASDVKTVRIRHVGDAGTRAFEELRAQVAEYDNASASDDEAIIARARTMRLGENKEKVLDRLFGLRLAASQSDIRAAVDSAFNYQDIDGDPLTVYGVVNGLTRVSQNTPYADSRVALDRAAGRVMEIAF